MFSKRFPSALRLSDIQSGESVFFLRSECGGCLLGRLTSLGFTPGVEIEMIQNYGHGPLMLNVRNSCIALGRREARKIYVQRREEK